METSTEAVAESAADAPEAAPATPAAHPGTAGQEGGDTSADEAGALLAARAGTAAEPDAADTGMAPTGSPARQEGAGPSADEAGADARPGNAGEPEAVDGGVSPAAVPDGQESEPRAAGSAPAPQPASTAQELDAGVTGVAPATQRGGDVSAETPGASGAELGVRPGIVEEAAGVGTAPTAVASPAGDPRAPVPKPGATPAAASAGQQGAGAAVGVADSGGGARAAGAPASLSPSRANDFMQCPLLYRFRVIDRLPEKPSAAATRGTLVHSVLERLFDAPAGERTPPAAKSLIPGQWDRLRESRPEVLELFADDPDGERLAQWLAEAEQLVERWFTLEDPTRLEPAERELFVEAELDSGLRLRGIIDRVDVAPTGEVRIVDYKTGKAPRPEYAEGALFQMKFYALVVWRLKNVIPRRLQLVYLGSGDVLTYDPVLADLERVERKLLALWEAIRQATRTGDWRPRPTKLCGWCDHQEHCPEFGGTPPPYPLPVEAATGEQGRMGPD